MTVYLLVSLPYDSGQESRTLEEIRSFIAIELPREIQTALDGVTRRLAQGGLPVRWVRAGNIHLTMKFLGEIRQAQVEEIIRVLQAEARQHKPFSFLVEGVGMFPNPRRPRVVWVGVKAPPELAILHRGIEAACEKLGFPPEDRGFSPHLTLGRVAQSAQPDDFRRLAELVSITTVGRLGEVRTDGLSLFKSELRPGGAVYSLMFHARLGQ